MRHQIGGESQNRGRGFQLRDLTEYGQALRRCARRPPRRPNAVCWHDLLCGRHFNELAGRRRWWNRLSVLRQTFQVKLNRFANQSKRFVLCIPGGDATRKIRNIRTVRCGTLFNYDQIAHGSSLLFLQPSLLQRAIQSAWRNVNARLARDSDCSLLGRMMKPAMATFGSDQNPTVGHDLRNELMDLHSRHSSRLAIGPHNVVRIGF